MAKILVSQIVYQIKSRFLVFLKEMLVVTAYTKPAAVML